MKFLWYSMQTIFILALVGVVGLFVLPYLPIDNNIELRIVESGSMEPAITTGSLVVVRPVESYGVGDVITFESRFTDVPTTHRILESYEERGETWFVTKGDANEEQDVEPVQASSVLGAVVVDVPRAGFVLDFARQPMGFGLLIVLPALLIILSEFEKIWLELRARRSRRDDEDDDGVSTTVSTGSKPITTSRTFSPRVMMDVGTPVRFREPVSRIELTTNVQPTATSPHFWPAQLVAGSVALLLALLAISSSFIGSTVSYFNDIEATFDNFLAAIALDVTAAGDGQLFQFIGTEPNGPDSVTVTIGLEAESVDVTYDVSMKLVGAFTTLCQQLETSTGAPLSYSGVLLGLTATSVTFAAPQTVDWSLPDDTGITNGEVCQAELVFAARAEDNEGAGGYLDEERVPLTFTYQAPVQPVAAPVLLQSAQLSPAGPSIQSTALVEEAKPAVAEDDPKQRPERPERPTSPDRPTPPEEETGVPQSQENPLTDDEEVTELEQTPEEPKEEGDDTAEILEIEPVPEAEPKDETAEEGENEDTTVSDEISEAETEDTVGDTTTKPAPDEVGTEDEVTNSEDEPDTVGGPESE